MPRRIIIDTDPGIDDAVAILLALASPELDVLGLVAVAGNLPLGVTELNARALAELAGRPEIPVHAGCPRPMSPAAVSAAHVHGDGGLGGLALPEPKVAPQPEHGVDFLVRKLREAKPKSITLCALGPLTNIAVALVMAPQIADRIQELVLMGGAARIPGNITPAAEFNIHCDPQAAAVVFESGVPITMAPLDVTQALRCTPEQRAPFSRLASRCGGACATLLGQMVAMHDPCVVAWLIAPQLFQGSEARVTVETQSALTMGMTLVDFRRRNGRPANARVLESVDADGFFGLLAERIARLP
ncbi:MAG TPA: nucleoside hydrolase [Stellaceae bacterium]